MFKTYTTLLYHNFRLPHRLLGVGNFLLARVLYKEKEKRDCASMDHEKRYFDNPFVDYPAAKECHLIDLETKKIHPEFLEKLKASSEKLLEVLEQNISSEKEDGSVYTGTAGIALLYYFLYEKTRNKIYLEKATNLIEYSLSKVRNRGVSFLCGDAGPMAIGAVLFHKQNNAERSRECVEQLLRFMPQVLDQKSEVPDELLYGRVGYLYSLLFINKYIPGTIPNSYFKEVISAVIISTRHPSYRSVLMYELNRECYQDGAHGIAWIMYEMLEVRFLFQVVNIILNRGRELAKDEKLKVPLMFEWHKKKYLGAAHGIAGILYVLLQCKEFMSSEQLEMVSPSIDFILNTRYRSGNFPHAFESRTDRLVHWCHGAPGTVQLLCEAYKTFGEPGYLAGAEACGNLVWERGLVKKGYGICHGAAGNAYAFLILYQLTNDIKHLYRACKFAEWCTTYNQHQERVPDRPFSLFEGLAGAIYFLVDIQDPLEAKFPCFTL